MFSFIMSVYNTKADWIFRAADSVINQTVPDWELLIVDDGSQEETAEYLEEIGKADERIRIFHQSNQGLSVARNTGMDHARGEYVAFIDADDWIEHTYISQTEPYLLKHHPDMLAFAHADHRSSDTKCNLHGTQEFYLYDRSEKKDLELTILHKKDPADMHSMFFGAQWNIIYRRAFLDENKIRNVPGLFKAQDSVFNLYAVEHAEKIAYLNRVLYHYNINDDSVTHKYRSGSQHICRLLTERRSFITKYHNTKEYLDVYDYGVLIVFDGLCGLNFFHPANPNPVRKRREELKSVLSDPSFSAAISEIDMRKLTFFKKMQVLSMRCKSWWMIKTLYLIRQTKRKMK